MTRKIYVVGLTKFIRPAFQHFLIAYLCLFKLSTFRLRRRSMRSLSIWMSKVLIVLIVTQFGLWSHKKNHANSSQKNPATSTKKSGNLSTKQNQAPL